MIYGAAGFAYWLFLVVKQAPAILKWLLLIVALPILLPYGLVTSLPLYLKKDGKFYKYRWLVYLTFLFLLIDVILFCLPV